MVDIYGIQRHVWAWVLGGIFAFAAALIGLWTVLQHFRYNHSSVAKYEIRILLMVPIYAVEAWLGLYQKNYTLYWDVLRESYEALVIYSFYSFLVTYLGGDEKLKEVLTEIQVLKDTKNGKSEYSSLRASSPENTESPEEKEEALKEAQHAGEHFSPCKYFMNPYGLVNGDFQSSMRVGILQYVPIKVFCAIATFILQFSNVYEGGHFAWTAGYPYIAFITNASQVWAMYCLVLFYHALHLKLKKIKPLAKFLAIKLVVFFTFWQSVLIAGLVELQFLNETQDYTNDQIAGGVQDFIICIEMLIAAIAHIWVFPPKEFILEQNARVPQISRLASVFNPADLAIDMHTHILRPAGQRLQTRSKQVKTSIFTMCCENEEIQLVETNQIDILATSPSLEIPGNVISSVTLVEEAKINLLQADSPLSELSSTIKTDFAELPSPTEQNLQEKLLQN